MTIMAGKSTTDQEIIEAIRKGGIVRERCEYIFYRRYVSFVARRPRKYKITDEEARDAYTEAFLAVVDHILSGRFRGDSSLKTYLSRIFRNKCVDQHRKNTTVKLNWVDEFPELPDSSRDFIRKLVGEESLQQVRQYIIRLGEKCRELLMLSASGYSPAEMAEKLGFKTPHSASSQRYKCLEKLKKEMSDWKEIGKDM